MGGLLCSRRSIDKDVLADRVAVDIYKLCKKEKRLLQQEWPRLLAYNPNIFRNAWMKTVHRSSSIKRTLGIVTDEEAPRNRCLIRLSTVVESFFSRIVATVTYDQPAVEEACKQLGASHRQYKSRGFQAIFWDIFMASFSSNFSPRLLTVGDFIKLLE
uniref:Globin family profile domain-containing protein n=1 Tax=Plectus sambesii TaxID=2011161 RepID=A0A914W3W3_9BILA